MTSILEEMHEMAIALINKRSFTQKVVENEMSRSNSGSDASEITDTDESSDEDEKRCDRPLSGGIRKNPGINTKKTERCKEEKSESTSVREMKKDIHAVKLVGDENAGTTCCLLL